MATGGSADLEPVDGVTPPSGTPASAAPADQSLTELPEKLPAGTGSSPAEPVADIHAADPIERDAAGMPGTAPATAQDDAAAATPRKRLFESTPTTPLAPPPAEQPTVTASATAPPVAEAAASAGSGISRGMAKLGWIRRPVPTDAIADTAMTGDRQLRRPTADLPPKTHADAADQAGAPGGTATSKGSSGDAPEPARNARPAHAAGPAIKPIGGGILRRR